jgi:hypothetical protein
MLICFLINYPRKAISPLGLSPSYCSCLYGFGISNQILGFLEKPTCVDFQLYPSIFHVVRSMGKGLKGGVEGKVKNQHMLASSRSQEYGLKVQIPY